MPFITVDGQLKQVSQAEFDDWNKAPASSTDSPPGGQPESGTTGTPAGGNVVQLNNTQEILIPNTASTSPGQTLPTQAERTANEATSLSPASDPSQFPAFDDNGNLQPGFEINNETGETYFKGAGSVAAPANLNDPLAGLTPKQLQDLGGADPTDPYIRARLGIPQLPGSQLNVTSGFGVNNPITQLTSTIGAALGTVGNAIGSLFSGVFGSSNPAPTPTPLAPASDPSQFPAFDDNGNLQPGFAINEETGDTYYQGFEKSTDQPVDPDADPFEQARLDAELALDQEPREFEPGDVPVLSDEDADALELEQAENRRILAEQATEVEPGTNPEVSSISTPLSDEEAEALFAEAEAEPAPVDPEVSGISTPLSDEEAEALFAEAEPVDPEVSGISTPLSDEEAEALFAEAEPVDPEVSGISTPLSDEEAEALFAEAEPVDENADPELQEPPGTDPVFTELAEPVDPDADPELLGGPEEEEGYTELAEPVDPDADPELLGGPEEEEGYEPLREPDQVDDPELLGGPEEEEGLEQLGGPTDVDDSDPATSGTGFGDDEGDAALFDQRAAEDRAAEKQATLDKARAQNTIANQRKNANNADWRVKLRLAPQANYLYAAPNPGILAPLKAQGGVIFPYTPSISTGYKANYSSYDLTHSNYKGYYYQNSAVEAITLSCPFTAQSTVEAEYLLAVIHFFKSVTKMFYGQDAERGTPPPLVYLTGLGEYQFNEHPCVVQSFTYELPTDVDYIRARSPNINNSNMLQQRQSNNGSTVGTTWGGGILGPLLGGAIDRLANAGLPKGGTTAQPAPKTLGLNSPTYVPTKINISISLLPVQSRKQQSQDFSLRQYANGDLLKGGFW